MEVAEEPREIEPEVIDVEEVVIEEAAKDAEEALRGEELSEQLARQKAGIAAKLRDVLEECERLEKVVKSYTDVDTFLFSDEVDVKKLLQYFMQRETDVEVVPEEPSEEMKQFFEQVRRKLIDCRWLKAMLKGKKTVSTSQLRYEQMPEELKTAKGVEI